MRNFVWLSTLLTVGSAVGLVVGACAPEFGTLDIDPISTPPAGVTLRDYLVELPSGVAIAVAVSARSDNAVEFDETASIDLISRDDDIFEVYPSQRPREFVFVGVAEGDTCIDVLIDGSQEDCINVQVEPPTQ